MVHHTRRQTGLPRWNARMTAHPNRDTGSNQYPPPIRPFMESARKSIKIALTPKQPKIVNSASKRHTSTPISRWIGWCTGWLRREAEEDLLPLRRGLVEAPRPEVERRPAEDFFCVEEAMRSSFQLSKPFKGGITAKIQLNNTPTWSTFQEKKKRPPQQLGTLLGLT